MLHWPSFSFLLFNSESQALHLATANVEITIPQKLLTHVYGENNNNLTQIRQVGLYILLFGFDV